MNNMNVYYSNKNKLLALILAFLVGAAGIHRFYLGRKRSGLIMLGLTIVGSLTMAIFIGEVISVIITCWVIYDMFSICTGKLTDSQGRPLKFK